MVGQILFFISPLLFTAIALYKLLPLIQRWLSRMCRHDTKFKKRVYKWSHGSFIYNILIFLLWVFLCEIKELFFHCMFARSIQLFISTCTRDFSYRMFLLSLLICYDPSGCRGKDIVIYDYFDKNILQKEKSAKAHISKQLHYIFFIWYSFCFIQKVRIGLSIVFFRFSFKKMPTSQNINHELMRILLRKRFLIWYIYWNYVQ